MVASGLSCRKPLGGTGWAISLTLCMNELRKHGPVGPSFLTVRLFSQSAWAVTGCEPRLLRTHQ